MTKRKQPLHRYLYLQSRRWHNWLGLAAAMFALLLSLTGIALNHKEIFFASPAKEPLQGQLTTNPAVAPPVSLRDALAVGRGQWGDVALEKVEFKEENGRLIYKVIAGGGRELTIDAHSGNWQKKDGYRLQKGAREGAPVETRIDWKKLLTDLHTGKIASSFGKLLVDAAAVALILLSLTGLYLWGLPLWKRRRGP